MKKILLIALLLFTYPIFSQVTDDIYVNIALEVNKEKYAKEYEEIKLLMSQGERDLVRYKKKIIGKTRNKIADMLYDESFSRDVLVDKNVTVFERFAKSIGDDEIYYIIFVDVWKSYGGSKTEVSFDLSYQYPGWSYSWEEQKWSIWINNKRVPY